MENKQVCMIAKMMSIICDPLKLEKICNGLDVSEVVTANENRAVSRRISKSSCKADD